MRVIQPDRPTSKAVREGTSAFAAWTIPLPNESPRIGAIAKVPERDTQQQRENTVGDVLGAQGRPGHLHAAGKT